MTNPSPHNIQLRKWILDKLDGSAEFLAALNSAIVSSLGTILTTRGDILTRGASSVERRARGATGQIPIAGASDWAWGDVSSILAITTKDGIHGEITYPEARTYVIILDAEIARTITALVTKTEAGTVTLTPKIGSTTLGGGASSVTSSKGTVSHSSANVMAANDTLSFVLSSVSNDCVGLSFSLKFNRALLNT